MTKGSPVTTITILQALYKPTCSQTANTGKCSSRGGDVLTKAFRSVLTLRYFTSIKGKFANS